VELNFLSKNERINERFEVFTAMKIRAVVFWTVVGYQRFEELYSGCKWRHKSLHGVTTQKTTWKITNFQFSL